jgi:AraC-like DNA-binding protein/copper chaperone CopZ
MTLYIKNMVCERCKKVLKEELAAIDVEIVSIELGRLEIRDHFKVDMSQINKVITVNGFELIEDKEMLLVESIKLFLISLVEQLPLQRTRKLSTLLAEQLNKDYSGLSKLFSRNEHITIEKFFVRLKLEKVKELIQQGNYSFTEIADLLDYTNSSHLSKQFKDATGLSMTEYRKSSQWSRKPLDKII